MRTIICAYQIALHLYPTDFKRDFGCEMAEVFALQLAHAETPAEAIAICWYAFEEVLTVALPMRVTDPRLVAPVASLLGAPAILLPLLWALNNPRALNLLAKSAFGPH